MSETTMTVQQKKDFDRAQKLHLRNMILMYQPKLMYTPEMLDQKTLKQLEKICSDLNI